jgi:hypothetical protein
MDMYKKVAYAPARNRGSAGQGDFSLLIESHVTLLVIESESERTCNWVVKEMMYLVVCTSRYEHSDD